MTSGANAATGDYTLTLDGAGATIDHLSTWCTVGRNEACEEHGKTADDGYRTHVV
jgi:hypothetical protein